MFSNLNYNLTDGNAAIVANSSTVNPDYLLGLYVYADGEFYTSAIAAVPGIFVRLTLPQPLAPNSVMPRISPTRSLTVARAVR